MKTSMKKSAVFVMMAAIAMFIVVGMASANGQTGKTIQGEYIFTASGGCLVSASNFKAPFYTNSFSLYGVWTFNRDGTGDGQGTQVAVTATSANPGASLVEYSFPFTYSIAHDGTITVVGGEITGNILAGSTVVGTFTVDKWSLSGMVSPDYKILTLATGAPEVETVNFLISGNSTTVYEICHRSDILIRSHF